MWQLIIQILARGTVMPSMNGPARNDVLPRTCHFEVVRPTHVSDSSAHAEKKVSVSYIHSKVH
jgi:hypothetical protein